MTTRPSSDPQPVVIELVPLDAASGQATGDRGRDDRWPRPPTAGVGTMPSASELLSLLIERALDTPDPPLVRGPAAAGAWPDLRVHRLVRLPPLDAARGLHAALVARGGRVPAPAPVRTHRGQGRPGVVRAAHLEVLATSGTSTGGLAAALHIGHHGRSTPVELVLEPWSEHHTDLSLEVRRRPGRTGMHLPRRYFDVAHRVMDVLWHQIEAAAAA